MNVNTLEMKKAPSVGRFHVNDDGEESDVFGTRS